MKAIVRKGYIVFHGNRRYEAGVEIPASILQYVLSNQSWKLEVIKDGKEKEESTEKREKKTEIKDIALNRMMSEKETKKRA